MTTLRNTPTAKAIIGVDFVATHQYFANKSAGHLYENAARGCWGRSWSVTVEQTMHLLDIIPHLRY